jgi:hypothetical protein
LLQCCNASAQFVDPLPENCFQSVSADFVGDFADSRKKFIWKPELLSLEAIFEMLKSENKKSQRELCLVSVVDVVQFPKNRHRKMSLSLLLYVALPCIIRMRDQSFSRLSLYSRPSSDLGENISDLIGGVNISPFGMAGYGINNLEFMHIPDECSHQFQALNYALLSIGDLISIW